MKVSREYQVWFLRPPPLSLWDRLLHWPGTFPIRLYYLSRSSKDPPVSASHASPRCCDCKHASPYPAFLFLIVWWQWHIATEQVNRRMIGEVIALLQSWKLTQDLAASTSLCRAVSPLNIFLSILKTQIQVFIFAKHGLYSPGPKSFLGYRVFHTTSNNNWEVSF